MSDQDDDLARIADNAAKIFDEMGWQWKGHDADRTPYIPGSARITLKLVRLLKSLKDDPLIVSAASGRLIVEREREFKDHFQISIDLGTIDVEDDTT